MRWQQMIASFYQNMFQELEKVLDGLALEDLHRRPAPGANTIGWLCWHTVRSCDRFLGDVVLGEQLWTAGWHKRFNRPSDHNDTGSGYTGAQVDALRIPSVQLLLLDYERAVAGSLMKYLGELTEQELDREAPNSQAPGTTRPVRARLVGILNNYQHVGQAGYVRGITRGHGWYGR